MILKVDMTKNDPGSKPMKLWAPLNDKSQP